MVKFLISSDHALYDDAVMEMKAAILDWWANPDKVFGVVNEGIHVAMIRDDWSVVRLCHHDEPATTVRDTAVFSAASIDAMRSVDIGTSEWEKPHD